MSLCVEEESDLSFWTLVPSIRGLFSFSSFYAKEYDHIKDLNHYCIIFKPKNWGPAYNSKELNKGWYKNH